MRGGCLLCSAKQYQRKDEHCLPSRYTLIVSKMKINHQKEAGKPTIYIENTLKENQLDPIVLEGFSWLTARVSSPSPSFRLLLHFDIFLPPLREAYMYQLCSFFKHCSNGLCKFF